jgi:hypothetical protein
MGDADLRLAQHQLEVLPALGADFPHVAEGDQVQRHTVAIEPVYHGAWVQFAQDKAVFGPVLAAARLWILTEIRCFRHMDSHWTISPLWFVRRQAWSQQREARNS